MQRALQYYDRVSGRLVSERIHAERFLDWSYNARLGRWTTEALFSRKAFSTLYGWVHRRRWSRRKIAPFIKRHGIDMSESLLSADRFRSFDDFFTREIDLARRPVHPDRGVCIAPADGRVFAFDAVDQDRRFPIKGSLFDLRGLLRDEALAERFSGGAMMICRLYLNDYHHFHFPDRGTPGAAMPINGRYYTVGPYARHGAPAFYSENVRALTLFETESFGDIAMVEIGAFTVGSIQQDYRPGVAVRKGAHKGRFHIGGSTVVLIFRPDAIELDIDLLSNTRAGYETYLRLGETIGRLPARSVTTEVGHAE